MENRIFDSKKELKVKTAMLKTATCLIAALLFAGLNSYAQKVKFIGKADEKYDGNKIVLYNRATGDHD